MCQRNSYLNKTFTKFGVVLMSYENKVFHATLSLVIHVVLRLKIFILEGK